VCQRDSMYPTLYTEPIAYSTDPFFKHLVIYTLKRELAYRLHKNTEFHELQVRLLLLNDTRNSNSVHTSQRTHYISITKPIRLFRKIIAVYCENHTTITGHVGFVVGNVAPGRISSEYFDFPCQLSIH
jgi:hypothetical protein